MCCIVLHIVLCSIINCRFFFDFIKLSNVTAFDAVELLLICEI